MLEKDFQKKLKEKIETRFPGAIVYKNEGTKGLPDLTVLMEGPFWALLECKRDPEAERTSREKDDLQSYWVNRANEIGFASFINPDTEGEVLNALEQALRAHRETRVSEPE